MSAHTCQVDDHLVHACRLMLGARAAGYDNVPANFDAQHLAHQRRTGARLDFAHAFASADKLPFTDRSTVTWARNRRGAWVIHNWKPAHRWADTTTPGGVARLREGARTVRQLGRRCMIVVHHEPENDLGHRGTAAGTPGEYRQMWRTVRDVFAEEGATDVVWGMAYMNYPKWDSLMPDLWPGDDLVDWLWMNAYGSASRLDPGDSATRFLSLTDRHGIAQGKPCGVLEWGVADVSRGQMIEYYQNATRFLDTAEADRLRAWVAFDSPGAHERGGLRIAYDDDGEFFKRKLTAYRHFVAHPKFKCQHVRWDGLPILSMSPQDRSGRRVRAAALHRSYMRWVSRFSRCLPI